MDKLRERDDILFKRYSEKLNGQFSMKLETVEEAIKWLVDNPGSGLWNAETERWHAFIYRRQFASSYDRVHYNVYEYTLPPGPYYTEKPRPERTIEESLEKLKGFRLHLDIDDRGHFHVGFNCGRPYYPKILPTLQSALSALVDEIEEGE